MKTKPKGIPAAAWFACQSFNGHPLPSRDSQLGRNIARLDDLMAAMKAATAALKVRASVEPVAASNQEGAA